VAPVPRASRVSRARETSRELDLSIDRPNPGNVGNPRTRDTVDAGGCS